MHEQVFEQVTHALKLITCLLSNGARVETFGPRLTVHLVVPKDMRIA